MFILVIGHPMSCTSSAVMAAIEYLKIPGHRSTPGCELDYALSLQLPDHPGARQTRLPYKPHRISNASAFDTRSPSKPSMPYRKI